MVPAGSVPTVSFERVHPGYIRKQRRVLVAHRIDDDVEFVVLTCAGLQLPCSPLLIVGAVNPGIQFDMRVEAELRSTTCQIGLNLRLLYKARCPVGIRGVRKGVGMGPDVTRQARVGVQAPGTPWSVQSIKYSELGEALLQKLSTCRYSSGASTNNGDTQSGRF